MADLENHLPLRKRDLTPSSPATDQTVTDATAMTLKAQIQVDWPRTLLINDLAFSKGGDKLAVADHGGGLGVYDAGVEMRASNPWQYAPRF